MQQFSHNKNANIVSIKVTLYKLFIFGANHITPPNLTPEHEKIVERIQLQIKEKNVVDAISDLKLLYNSFSALVEGLLKFHPINYRIWEEYLHDLNYKFLFCNRSIITLIESFYYELTDTKYHDVSSVFILNRSLIESYLTYFYNFKMPLSDDEALANHYMFKISGLAHKQNYTVFQDSTDRLSDEIKIKTLQQKLENNPFFAGLSIKDKYRKELLNGKFAMRFSFPDLIKKSQLSDELFIDRWKLYSNYAHSESIGLMQMRYYSTNTQTLNLTYYLTVIYPLMLMSCYFQDLLEQFKSYEYEIGDFDDEVIVLIKFWVEMSQAKSITGL